MIIVIWRKWTERKLQGNNNFAVIILAVNRQHGGRRSRYLARHIRLMDPFFFSPATKKGKAPCCCGTGENNLSKKNKKAEKKKKAVKQKMSAESEKELFLSPLIREMITGWRVESVSK